jgi:hypothetical protein
MEVNKILLCVVISAVAAGFAQAESGESAKVSSGLRFLEAPQTGKVRGEFAVTGSFSNRKQPALAAAGVKLVSDNREVPASSRGGERLSTRQLIGNTLASASFGSLIGLCVAGLLGAPLTTGMVAGALITGSIVLGSGLAQ